MAAQKGKDLLLKIADGQVFSTVAGLRSNRLAFNAATVDVSDAESAGRWRELLSGAGLKRASVSGSGIFKDAASDALVRGIFFSGKIESWRVIVPDFGTVSGAFQVTALEYAGKHDGEMTFELALESAGELTFEAV
ncbi:phage major tail protein, TP901-1 family [Pararhizobium mangrovi]|uniref:Phage major tail protein, TP901-1 family n=1 Tax=Pararhizobium mangrovi TaxID=2590452 RepID=A0A506UHH5_9HYPH|nr:phage major tail protein, TP901-1 family [Pararhizobium mangrovi]TPW32759.1 phage major tail protein, TP901-1 family [Pararhizobium mangrovi]